MWDPAFSMLSKHSTTRLHLSSRKMTTLDAGVIPEQDFSPSNPLQEGLEYTIQVTSGSIKDT